METEVFEIEGLIATLASRKIHWDDLQNQGVELILGPGEYDSLPGKRGGATNYFCTNVRGVPVTVFRSNHNVRKVKITIEI